MNKKTYIIATIKPWNIRMFKDVICKYPGTWHLITGTKNLTLKKIKHLAPRYIFFPHWSHIVPRSILNLAECVCFHETDLPFGRGGSPIQNLIARGYKKTKITALRMTQDLDAGPIYLKRALSLHGRACDIFNRSSKIVAGMIKEIIANEPVPKAQKGRIVTFSRRTPEQSRITSDIRTLEQLFDHIRMLDAQGYPKAFIEDKGLRYEFSYPSLNAGYIEVNAQITKIKPRSKK